MQKAFFQSLVVLLAILLFSSRSLADVNPQALQGTWSGSNGQDVMILMFQGNVCALGLNGQQMAGMWNLAGNRLNLQFQNGRTISYQIALEGNTLVLDGSVRLARQGAPQGGWGGAPTGGNWGGINSGAPTGGSWGNPQSSFASPLEGMWSVQMADGRRSFRFTGNRYAQIFNGQVLEEGIFEVTPDGRFRYQVTNGQFAGQSGENRVQLNGNALTVAWPDGTVVTFMREGSMDTGIPPQARGPLDGRWVWAKNGPVSFGYIFQGNRFIFFYNGQEKGRGTFSLSQVQLIMHHETGPDAGKTDMLGYQLSGNRLLIFTREDQDPIPFVRQN